MRIRRQKRKQPAAVNQRSAMKWRRRRFDPRPMEAQSSTFNQSKEDVLGDDGQNTWLNVDVCGWCEAYERKKMVRIQKNLIKWLKRHLVKNVERR